MVATSSTKNVWSHEVDDGKTLMGSSGGISVMEKAAESGGDRKQPPPPPQQQALKCPRCDSSNTKFCYYNNYSLSQPRHFCKACKRYWTRGGTLRNVPVGGGCRKNKRVKRHPPPPLPVLSSSVAANDGPMAAGTVPLSLHHQHQPQIADHLVNPFLYRYPGSEQGFDPGFEHHHHNMGLGFSFSGLLGSVENNPGFVIPPSTSYLAFGSSSSCSSSASSLASLIASRLHYQGGCTNNGGGFHGGGPYIENFGSGEIVKEEVKMEVENSGGGVSNNTHFQMGNFNTSDKNNDDNNNDNNDNNNPSSLSWNWFDPPNMGSSVPSIL